MQKPIYKMLEEIDKLSNQKEKVQALNAHQYRDVLANIINLALNPNIKWLLPEGDPPYKPCEFDAEGRLLVELRRLYLFLEGGNQNLKQTKREQLFIDILESIDPNDAKLLLAMKDKKLPFKSINKVLAKKAFPEIW
jgi:hypothetical protein